MTERGKSKLDKFLDNLDRNISIENMMAFILTIGVLVTLAITY